MYRAPGLAQQRGSVYALDNKNDAVDAGHANPGSGRQIRSLDPPGRIIDFDLADAVDDGVTQREDPAGVLLAALIQ